MASSSVAGGGVAGAGAGVDGEESFWRLCEGGEGISVDGEEEEAAARCMNCGGKRLVGMWGRWG